MTQSKKTKKQVLHSCVNGPSCVNGICAKVLRGPKGKTADPATNFIFKIFSLTYHFNFRSCAVFPSWPHDVLNILQFVWNNLTNECNAGHMFPSLRKCYIYTVYTSERNPWHRIYQGTNVSYYFLNTTQRCTASKAKSFWWFQQYPIQKRKQLQRCATSDMNNFATWKVARSQR